MTAPTATLRAALRAGLVAALAAVGVAATPERADAQGVSGYWRCESSATPARRGVSGVIYRYEVSLDQGGGFRARGQIYGVSGAMPFEASGRWSVRRGRRTPQRVVANGAMRSAWSQGPFAFDVDIYSAGEMGTVATEPSPLDPSLSMTVSTRCRR